MRRLPARIMGTATAVLAVAFTLAISRGAAADAPPAADAIALG